MTTREHGELVAMLERRRADAAIGGGYTEFAVEEIDALSLRMRELERDLETAVAYLKVAVQELRAKRSCRT